MIRFDRVLANSASARVNYRISSGTVVDVVFKKVRVDPVERTVTLALDAPLQRNTLYRLRVRAADNPGDRLASFDGTPFEGEYVQDFVTKAEKDPADTEDVDLDPIPADPCAVQAIFRKSCTGADCHGSPSAGVTTARAMGLSLDSDLGLQQTAIGHASVLVQRAANPGSGGAAPLAGLGFPRGLPIVDRREGGSTSSFLLYKLLLAGPAELGQFGEEAVLGAPLPKGLAAPDGRVADLWRRTIADLSVLVPGSGMPPSAPLRLEEIRAVRRWIDGAGAVQPTEACTGDAGTDATDAEAGASDGSVDSLVDGG